MSAIIDEIMEFKDDPKYAYYSDETTAHMMDLNKRYRATFSAFMKEQPEQHVERVRSDVASLYGLEHLDKSTFLSSSLKHVTRWEFDLIDVARDEGLWKRLSELCMEKHGAASRIRGPTIVFALSYELRVQDHQITVQAIKQLDEEGLLDTTKLFPKGGSHESVGRNVEVFDRLLYAEWNSSLKPMSEREKKVEFRMFIAHRAKTWGREYRHWLLSR